MRDKKWIVGVLIVALIVFYVILVQQESKQTEVLDIISSQWEIPVPDVSPTSSHSNHKHKKREAVMGYVVFELDEATYSETVDRIRLVTHEEYHPESLDYLDGYTAQSLGLLSDYGKLEKKLKKLESMTTWIVFRGDSSDAVCIVADYTQNTMIYILNYELTLES